MLTLLAKMPRYDLEKDCYSPHQWQKRSKACPTSVGIPKINSASINALASYKEAKNSYLGPIMTICGHALVVSRH